MGDLGTFSGKFAIDGNRLSGSVPSELGLLNPSEECHLTYAQSTNSNPSTNVFCCPLPSLGSSNCATGLNCDGGSCPEP